MTKVYIDKHGIVWTNNEDLKPNGIALTYEQLEQLKREYFEAGQKSVGVGHMGDVTFETGFEEYEATKKDGEG